MFVFAAGFSPTWHLPSLTHQEETSFEPLKIRSINNVVCGFQNERGESKRQRTSPTPISVFWISWPNKDNDLNKCLQMGRGRQPLEHRLRERPHKGCWLGQGSACGGLQGGGLSLWTRALVWSTWSRLCGSPQRGAFSDRPHGASGSSSLPPESPKSLPRKGALNNECLTPGLSPSQQLVSKADVTFRKNFNGRCLVFQVSRNNLFLLLFFPIRNMYCLWNNKCLEQGKTYAIK